MRYLALALCLLLIVPVNVIAQQEEGTAVLSVDAFERADYFDLIEKDDLLNIRVQEANPNFRDIGGVLFSKDGRNLLLYPNGRAETEYRVPEGTERIDEECTFGYGCRVERLILPASFRELGGAKLFRTVIREFVVAEDNPYLTAIDGVLFSRDGKTLVMYPPGRTDPEYAVPDGTETIDEWAFTGNRYLQRIVMPDSLQVIGDAAFSECEKLASVRLPSVMRSIGQGAFMECFELEDIRLPGGLTELSWQVLCYTGLRGTLRIPEGIIEIGGEAIAQLPLLTDIYLPDSLERIWEKYTRETMQEWHIDPLHLIYGWNDTGVADYTVVMHAHEGTFAAELVEYFPHILTPAGEESMDLDGYAAAVRKAMDAAGNVQAVLRSNDGMDWLLEKPLVAYAPHEAVAVFEEDGELLLCGFDDRPGDWQLSWINRDIFKEGVAPVKLSFYGSDALEIVMPDAENTDDAVEYRFERDGGRLILTHARWYKNFLNYEYEELYQCSATDGGLVYAEPDEWDAGTDENGQYIDVVIPGKEIMRRPAESLALESFRTLAAP